VAYQFYGWLVALYGWLASSSRLGQQATADSG